MKNNNFFPLSTYKNICIFHAQTIYGSSALNWFDLWLPQKKFFSRIIILYIDCIASIPNVVYLHVWSLYANNKCYIALIYIRIAKKSGNLHTIQICIIEKVHEWMMQNIFMRRIMHFTLNYCYLKFNNNRTF